MGVLGGALPPPPRLALEVLEWTATPLATKEVAVVCDIPVEDAREALGRVAEERHVGFDGFWSPPEAAAVRQAA